MKKSVRIYVDGTVQGIFFRSFIKQNAERLNVKGFVRNLEDSRVEVFAEGNTDEIHEMIKICKRGPKHSQIRNTEIRDERFQDFKSFKILHI